MALGESKLQLIDLLGLAQLANQRGYGRQTPSNTVSNSNYDRAMRQEALKQEQLKSLLAQNEYEQQTSVPTITVPGVMASGGSMGGAYKVPITDLPGQVSGQRASTYGQQAHEGFMQTGRLMSDMAQTAASSNARVGAGEARAKSAGTSTPNAWRGYGVYPLEASGIKDILAEAAKTKADAAATQAQRNQLDAEYKNMGKGREEESKNFSNNISNIEKQGPKEVAMAKELGSTINNQTQNELRVIDLKTRLNGDFKNDEPILQKIALLRNVPYDQLLKEYNIRLMNQ